MPIPHRTFARMAQHKLERFAAIKEFANVFEYPEGMAGHWHAHFGNQHPIILELACGKGEYAVGLGQLFPEKNFVGVDVKGNRIFVGAKKALAADMKNVAFLRTQIDRIAEFFAENEVQEAWITFPDPQLRFSKHKKRLTHPRFLRLYQRFMSPGAIIHLKTDSPHLYRFTKTVINFYQITLLEDCEDVHGQAIVQPELKIKTHYEGLDIAGSNRIHYLKFVLPSAILPIEKDADLKELLREIEVD